MLGEVRPIREEDSLRGTLGIGNARLSHQHHSQTGYEVWGSTQHTKAPKGCLAWLCAYNLGGSLMGYSIVTQCMRGWDEGGVFFVGVFVGKKLDDVLLIIVLLVEWNTSGMWE